MDGHSAWRANAWWLLLSFALVTGCSSSATTSAPTGESSEAPVAALATEGTGVTPASYDRPIDQSEPFASVALPEAKPLPDPVVVFKTSLGDVSFRLDMQHSQRTVLNFVSYVNSGHYNGTIFHQVEPGYAIVGGAFTPDLVEKPARYPIPSEANNGQTNRRGTIAMARKLDDPHSATCQFIINLSDNPMFDHQGEAPEQYGFCVFGEVIDGFDVLDRIAAVQVQATEQFPKLPVEAVTIQSARLSQLDARKQAPVVGNPIR